MRHLLVLGLVLLCVACASTSEVAYLQTSLAQTPVSAPTPTIPPARTIQPTRTPVLAPTAKPTTRPTAKPTPKPTPFPYHICTFASCSNPWGYHLQNGINGSGVQSAPAGFCSWFLCAANFASTGGPGGMIVACNDNNMDWTQDYYANRCGNDNGIRGYLTP
jgi:hypothetical protein